MRKGSYSEVLVKDVVDACDLHVENPVKTCHKPPQTDASGMSIRSLMSGIASVLEEEHSRPQTTKRLVRRRRDLVAMLEGRGVLLRGNKARDVSDVHREDGTNLIRDGAEPRKIDGARVGRGTTENHGRAEEQRVFPQLLVFDDAHLGVHIARERLEVEGCGGDLLLGCVVTVGQVPTTWQAEAHDARVRCQQSRVHGKVQCR